MTKSSKKAPSVDSLDKDTVPKLPDLPDPRRLHDATDRLNAVLHDFERTLGGLKLGVTASVTLDEDEHGWFKQLAFTKSGNEFKLVIETGNEFDDRGVETTALTSASRETRLQAVAALPKLYKQLLKQFEAEIERVNESITDVQRLADAIRTRAGK